MNKKNTDSPALANKGFLLVTSLAVTVFLTLGSASLLVNSLMQTNANTRLYNRANALQLAEAGLNQAGLNLRTSATADDVLSDNLASGSFAVTLQESLGNNLYRVQATGTGSAETRSLEGFYRSTFSSVFQFAAFGDELVELSGNMKTDSYDSRNGEYNDPNNIGNHGDIGTNSTSIGGIEIDGDSFFVDGQLMIGPDVADPTANVTGYDADQISGGDSGTDVTSMPSTVPMTPVVVPVGLTCADVSLSGGNMPLSIADSPLGDGSYCFHDLSLSGGATVTPSDAVKVYLTGTLTLVGNTTVGNPNDPTDLIFYMTANSVATIEGTFEGTSAFYGGLYAPEATIAIGGTAEIYGAISANRIHITGNAEIHYDEAMADLETEPGYYTTELTAWQEL